MSLIYSMTCNTCGDELVFEPSLDNDGDLQVDVEPCEGCTKKSHQEGYDEAKAAFEGTE